MKDGAVVGLARTVWFDGSDNLAIERLQLGYFIFGKAKFGTIATRSMASKTSKMDDIINVRELISVEST